MIIHIKLTVLVWRVLFNLYPWHLQEEMTAGMPVLTDGMPVLTDGMPVLTDGMPALTRILKYWPGSEQATKLVLVLVFWQCQGDVFFYIFKIIKSDIGQTVELEPRTALNPNLQSQNLQVQEILLYFLIQIQFMKPQPCRIQKAQTQKRTALCISTRC